MAPASIRGSSNGRTPGFGPGYRGSNPCPRENTKRGRFDGLSLYFSWIKKGYEPAEARYEKNWKILRINRA